VANPETVAKLANVATLMAIERQGRLVCASVVPSPDDERPSEHHHDAFSSAQTLVERGAQTAQARGVECDRRVAVGEHIHEALAHIADAEDADLLVMGMSECAHPTLLECDLDFDRIVDAVAAHAPCNVLVAKFRDGMHFDRALVPVSRSTPVGLAREVVVAFHHQAATDIDFVYFAPTEELIQPALDELNHRLKDAELDHYGRALVKVSPNPANGIVHASDGYDLVVVGTPPLHVLRRQLLGSVAERVIQEAHSTTLVMRTVGVG
jgi:nucleotide-binding universal stress UspA family protein